MIQEKKNTLTTKKRSKVSTTLSTKKKSTFTDHTLFFYKFPLQFYKILLLHCFTSGKLKVPCLYIYLSVIFFEFDSNIPCNQRRGSNLLNWINNSVLNSLILSVSCFYMHNNQKGFCNISTNLLKPFVHTEM